MDLSQLSLTEQLRALAAGDVAPEEIWRASEARLPAARACNALTYEPPSSELSASRANAKEGPLAGAAIGVKDNIAVACMPFTGGSPAFSGHVGTADAGAVAALREAGAVVSARLNLHELAFGITSNNPHYGQVLNPFDRTRMAGGSSGGSAVAVALGAVSCALGTDTGGSGRIPAAFCGVVGYRPTTGRYPVSGVLKLTDTRDTIALFTRAAADLPLLDAILAGGRLHEAAAPPVDYWRGKRIGVPRRPFYDNLHPDVAAGMDAALILLQDAGAVLVEADMSEVADLDGACGMPIALYETARLVRRFAEGAGLSYDALMERVVSPDVKAVLEAALTISDDVYRASVDETRPRLLAAYAHWFSANEADVAALPTAPLPAPLVGDDETTLLNGAQVPTFETVTRNVRPTSVVGAPSISLPAPLVSGDLPVGLCLDGRVGDDGPLIEAAIAFEALRGPRPMAQMEG